jgi:hypothetical protein
MPQRAQQATEYSLDVMPGSRIARFHWRGPITPEDRKDNVRRMVDFCREHHLQNLLIDGRSQQPVGGTIEDFDFGSCVPTEMRGLRIAVLHRPDDEALKFIETVAFNRGGNTQPFTDQEAAVQWLQSFDRND